MERMSTIHLFLADDHAVVREGLKRLIEAEPDMRVVGEAADGDEAAALVPALRPDVVVLDVSLPGLNGIEVARRLRDGCPDVKLLVLTLHDDGARASALLLAGVHGYLLKRSAATDIVPAIRVVAAGGFQVDRGVTLRLMAASRALATEPAPAEGNLSERELEVLRLIARGYSNKEVAARLEVSVKTVETHKTRSMKKLGLHDRVGIVRHAHRHDWLREPWEGEGPG